MTHRALSPCRNLDEQFVRAANMMLAGGNDVEFRVFELSVCLDATKQG